jgi:uncharacterized Ntn-hydrolase superfamily protein
MPRSSALFVRVSIDGASVLSLTPTARLPLLFQDTHITRMTVRALPGRRSLAAGVLLATLAVSSPRAAQTYAPGAEGTFSIIGRDPRSGELGIAVHSKTIAVGARVRGGKGGVAVFAHQSSSNPMYSDVGVELLEAGMTPQQALDYMLRADEGRNSRQVAVLDIEGRTAAWTSPTITDWKGHRCGVDFCAQGNTLTGPEVVDSMARSFESSTGPLAERLLDALEAGQRAGGDRRGVQSASLMILRPLTIAGWGDRALDLRVDEHKDPFSELRRILRAVRSGDLRSEASRRLNASDFPAALERASAARDMSPEIDANWVTLAQVHLRMGQRTEALAAIRRAVELNPANRRQLPANRAFESLANDPEFRRIVGGG